MRRLVMLVSESVPSGRDTDFYAPSPGRLSSLTFARRRSASAVTVARAVAPNRTGAAWHCTYLVRRLLRGIGHRPSLATDRHAGVGERPLGARHGLLRVLSGTALLSHLSRVTVWRRL